MRSLSSDSLAKYFSSLRKGRYGLQSKASDALAAELPREFTSGISGRETKNRFGTTSIRYELLKRVAMLVVRVGAVGCRTV